MNDITDSSLDPPLGYATDSSVAVFMPQVDTVTCPDGSEAPCNSDEGRIRTPCPDGSETPCNPSKSTTD